MSIITPCTQTYALKQLLPSDLPQIMTLQQTVIDHLPPLNKNFIVPKTAEQFHQRMTQCGTMIGHVTQNGALVSYGGIAFPTKSWPTADMLINPQTLPCGPTSLSVIQNSVVHPEHRKKGLHGELIAVREQLCKTHGKSHAMGEVAAANPASLKGFLKTGYHVTHASIDPDDGCLLLFLHKTLGAAPTILKSPSALSLDPVKKFSKAKLLLNKGHRGHALSRTDDKNGYVLHFCTLALK
ncbi:MAG: hypothetical protein WC612_00815 [Bdellovibrionales bacterium]|jgi:hypothetical protein